MALRTSYAKYDTSLLPETAVDLFQEGEGDSSTTPHAKITKALARTILLEERSYAISLTGPFGGGKSTIVSNLGKAIEDVPNDSASPSDAVVFTYDAWTHQGDSIRRSFLQELVDTIEDTYIRHEKVEDRRQTSWKKKRDRWGEELAPILSQSGWKTSTSDTTLTFFGVVLALSTLIASSFFTLITAFHDPGSEVSRLDQLLKGQDTLRGSLIILSLLGGLAILVLGWKIYEIDQNDRSRTGERHGRNGGHANDSNGSSAPIQSRFRLQLVNSSSNTEHYESIERAEPSTYDFRKAFDGIVRDLLDGNKNLRLVVAVDNLDRLPPEEQRYAWSTLQTFFDLQWGSSDDNASEDWRKRFWLIVPFDPDEITGFGEDEVRLSITPSLYGAEGSDGSTVRLNTIDSSGAWSFIDKTFQANVEVPFFIDLDLEGFFYKMIRNSFIGIEDELSEDGTTRKEKELWLIYNAKPESRDLMSRSRPLRHSSRTPRDVKRFLNDLVIKHRQRLADVDLRVEAVAVALSRMNCFTKKDLLDDALILPYAVELGMPRDTLRMKLVCLLFGNQDESKALNLLLGKDVENALNSGDSERMRELYGQKIKGFDALVEDALRRIRDPDRATVNLRKITNAARALQVTERSEDVWSSLRDALLKRLTTGTTNADSRRGWQDGLPFDEAGHGIAIIIDEVKDPETMRVFLEAASSIHVESDILNV